MALAGFGISPVRRIRPICPMAKPRGANRHGPQRFRSAGRRLRPSTAPACAEAGLSAVGSAIAAVCAEVASLPPPQAPEWLASNQVPM